MKKISPVIFIGILSACNPSSEKKINFGLAIDNTVPNPYREKLVGRWLQPIAGQQKERRGFDLHEDSTAASVNNHRMKYLRWNVSEDTLFLYYRTEETEPVSRGIDTLIIKEIDDSELILSPPGGKVDDTESYHKEN